MYVFISFVYLLLFYFVLFTLFSFFFFFFWIQFLSTRRIIIVSILWNLLFIPYQSLGSNWIWFLHRYYYYHYFYFQSFLFKNYECGWISSINWIEGNLNNGYLCYQWWIYIRTFEHFSKNLNSFAQIHDHMIPIWHRIQPKFII